MTSKPSGHLEYCSVCFRRVGINSGDDGSPPVDLGRCASTGGFECRAVGQAVYPYRCESEAIRSNNDRLSSELKTLKASMRRVLDVVGCICKCGHAAGNCDDSCEPCVVCQLEEALD